MKDESFKITKKGHNKKLFYRALACLVTLGVLGTLSYFGVKNYMSSNNTIIINETSIVDTLKIVKDQTKIDDILLNEDFKGIEGSDFESNTFLEIIDVYNKNRIKISGKEQLLHAATCYNSLECIGKMLIKATLISELESNNINYDKIFIDYDNYEIIVEGKEIINDIVAGGLTIPTEKPFKLTYKAKRNSELDYLFINIQNAREGKEEMNNFRGENVSYDALVSSLSIEKCDDIYKSFERYLLSSRGESLNDKCINMELDQEKVDAYNNYKTKLLNK